MKRRTALSLIATWSVVGYALGDDKASQPESTAETKPVSALRKVMDESVSWDELFVTESATTPMSAKVVLR